MGSKTGGNTEPMPFVRKWGSTANTSDSPENPLPAPPPELVPPEMDTSFPERGGSRDRDMDRSRSREPRETSRSKRDRSRSKERRDRSKSRDRRDRSRSRDRDRDRDRKKRKRSRSRSKDRRRRRRSGSRDRKRSRSRDRRRSRSRDRKTRSPSFEMTPSVPVIRAPKEPVVNPLLRPDFAAAVTSGEANPEGVVTERKRERKSRWSTNKSFVPGMPTILPSNLTEDQQKAYLLQLEVEDATRKLRLGDFGGPIDPAQRSPSPEPIYDANGKRLNTRDVRKRQELEQYRHEKIQELMKVDPNFKPPTDYRPPNIRLNDKVWIPQENHPEINFVGLLIGPRGNTLKSLEQDTGAKIIIRGKGSVKEGKLGSRMGPLPGENEPLHAYVTASDHATIKRACEKIKSIIAEATCIPDGQNELRKLQLRELALLNGTLRPEDLAFGARCSNCGSDEHKTWECLESANVTARIICASCGGAGHLTRDCKNPNPMGFDPNAGAGMDDEYSALMEELGEKPKSTGLVLGSAASAPKSLAPPPQELPMGFPGFPGPPNNNSRAHMAFPGFVPPPPELAPPPGFFAHTAAALRGKPNAPAPPPATTSAASAYRPNWYGSAMPMPVPPPPPPMGGFPPPPPPPPPVPQPDFSRLLGAPPPPPPQ